MTVTNGEWRTVPVGEVTVPKGINGELYRDEDYGPLGLLYIYPGDDKVLKFALLPEKLRQLAAMLMNMVDRLDELPERRKNHGPQEAGW